MEDQQHSIVVIDDNPSDIRLMAEAMGVVNQRVKIRPIINGAEAAALLSAPLKAPTPCALVLDYQLPIMSGLTFLRELAGHPYFSKIPIVVWTGNTDARISILCKREGAAVVRVKPYGFDSYVSFARDLAALAQVPGSIPSSVPSVASTGA